MHLNEHQIRAYCDHQLSGSLEAQVREHLSRCPDCKKHLDDIASQAKAVHSRLNVLTPMAWEQPHPARAAYARFASSTRMEKSRKEFIKNMFTRRRVWASLAVLTVLALVFTITPARAWASSLLGLFRVQKVQVITFDPAAAQNAQQQLEVNDQVIQQIFQDDLKITHHGKMVSVASAAEAANQAGFTPRVPTAIENPVIAVEPGMNAVFTIDQPKLQELINAVGADVQLPRSVNGKVVTVDVPDGVSITSGCKGEQEDLAATSQCTSLFQLPSPVVNAPDDLDIPRLGQAMFQFLGLSPVEARQLSQRIDWTTTLVLPIPTDGQVKYQEVQVDGVTGTLLQSENENRTMLIWVKDGMLYGLQTPNGADEALRIAGSLQ